MTTPPATVEQETMSGWIGVDLDGTLAHYDGWAGPESIGAPVPLMLARVREWIAQGREVRIFTARCCVPEQVPPIRAWLAKHGLGDLAVTNVKDFAMIELWDDRCIQVMPNTGQTWEEEIEQAKKVAAESEEWKDSAQVRLAACVEKDKEIAALRADAERYRWLRVQRDMEIALCWALPHTSPLAASSDPCDIDAAIDAARAKLENTK